MKALLLASIATCTLSSIAFAGTFSLAKMTDQQLDQVVAGWEAPPPLKGNNGWGNGADPTNPGSFSGNTAPSKSTNSSVPSEGKINTNPTTSTGR
jgi:hypothetical protein